LEGEKPPNWAGIWRTARRPATAAKALRGKTMPEKVSITKPNTVETFMKANTDLRISADTLKEFQTQLDALAGTITKESEKQAKASGRTTIMPTDIKAAMTAVVGSTSDVSYLFSQLEKLNAKDTATMSTLIQNWIGTH